MEGSEPSLQGFWGYCCPLFPKEDGPPYRQLWVAVKKTVHPGFRGEAFFAPGSSISQLQDLSGCLFHLFYSFPKSTLLASPLPL